MFRTTAAVSSVCASLLIAGAAFFQAGPDYATIPPEAGAVAAQLKGVQVDLAKAIQAAEQATGSRALSASAKGAAGQPVTAWEVICYGEDTATRVVINSTDASVVLKTDIARFPGAPVDGDWTELPSGLKYYDMVVGDGAMPPGSSSKVSVHYTGWLVDGTKFDSSVDRGAPATFPLNGVISGWTEGVGSMRVGGKRKLIIPFQLAYGPNGRGPIPARATLIFDVELLDIVE